MFERAHARAILSAISAENLDTTFCVRKGKLVLTGKLTEKQRELASKFKEELIWYLMTPPDSSGDCTFCGGPIWWLCNKYGVWICSCYYATNARKVHESNRKVCENKRSKFVQLPLERIMS